VIPSAVEALNVCSLAKFTKISQFFADCMREDCILRLNRDQIIRPRYQQQRELLRAAEEAHALLTNFLVSNLRKEKTMSRMKSLFAVLLLTACVGFASVANAAPVVKIMIASSSAMWQ
jgi:hypothetical protein